MIIILNDATSTTTFGIVKMVRWHCFSSNMAKPMATTLWAPKSLDFFGGTKFVAEINVITPHSMG